MVLIHLPKYFGDMRCYLVVIKLYFSVRHNFILKNVHMVLVSYNSVTTELYFLSIYPEGEGLKP